ncbi:hypothetical protein M405DRAFT_342818 [Rhizopogon salebrosus TDB-379]|nr:hypothetical protein M405DRAFT_342818 [Rhizopogon salebrosus TDB-379]
MGSAIMRAIFKKILLRSTPDIFTKSSAIHWTLETSTNPEIVEVAAAMIPRVQWPSKLDASAIYARLLDNFADSVDRPELFVTYGKVLTHLRIQSLKASSIDWKEMITWHTGGERNRFIHNAFMDARLAYDQYKKTGNKVSQWKHMADARTALRTMLVYGLRVRHHASLPDDEGLIWNADLRWSHSNGHTPSCSDFDWLIDYLSTKAHNETDDETVGDALLALSAMHGLGSPARRLYYVNALIHCMAPTRPSRVRYAALRAVSDARDDLASITSDSMSWGVDATLLDELSHALMTVVRSNHDQGKFGSRLDPNFIDSRDASRCYFRLIFSLAKDGEWCKRLTRDGHVGWCLSLLDKLLFFAPPLAPNNFYLTGIFLRTNLPGKNTLLSAAPWAWLTLIDGTWFELCY